MPAPLSREVAVVTGGSRSLGRAICLELASRGFFVIVNYRSQEKEARETVAQIEAAGGSGRILRADIAQPAEVQQMFRQIYEQEKRVDILVNNAGITRDGYFIGMRSEMWHDVIQTNLNGTFYACKAVVRSMCAAGRGVIINIGSGAALSPRAGQINYAAAKSSLIGFSKSLAREVANKGVRVLVVAPGFIDTDMSRILPANITQQTLDLIPLGRWGKPEEIAAVVGFVSSPEAAGLTGQTLIIDGGRGAVESDYGLSAAPVEPQYLGVSP